MNVLAARSASTGWIGAILVVAALAADATIRARADSAAVLPAGVSRVYGDFYHYLPTTERYNPDGEREDLAYPFTDAALDSSVFTSLAPLDPLVGGTASIGDVAVSYEYDIDVFDAGYNYGITDKLTVGFHIPYYWIKNNVDATFSSANANVGLNPATGACCIPIGAGGVPMNTEDVQQLIRSDFGFATIQSWSREGIGDIELGGKYRFFRDESSAFAVTGGARLPTGYADDPDDLTDVPWSYGNYALLLRLHYDYKLSNLWSREKTPLDELVPSPGDVIVNGTFRYDYMFPDEKVKRIGDTPDQVFTNNREKVSRKLGDIFGFEVAGKYQLTERFAFTAIYTYSFKLKDEISGNMGYNYSSLEANTDSDQQIAIIRASYSTLGAYRDGKASVPLYFTIAYRNRFAGEGPRSGQANPILTTSWVVASLNVLF
ncbi:MAG: hypothetical protein R3286_03625 [Gammaproteobacteria bacterium]|nr:hypothetical protein [Gammaproteobacteria bacterium]